MFLGESIELNLGGIAPGMYNLGCAPRPVFG
jgi:hypothetical protein